MMVMERDGTNERRHDLRARKGSLKNRRKEERRMKRRGEDERKREKDAKKRLNLLFPKHETSFAYQRN